GLLRQGPQSSCPAVQCEESGYRGDSGFQVFAGDEKDSRNVTRGLRKKRAVVDATFVDDECSHTLRLPCNELVIELAAGGHAPQEQRRRCQLRMLRTFREHRDG